MAKPELGIKRVCSSCAAKFYDLNKHPIVCPKCATVFAPPAPAPARPRRVVYSPPAIEAAGSKVPAKFAPLTVTDGEADGAEPPAAEEDLDEKKADAGLIVLEEDDERRCVRYHRRRCKERRGDLRRERSPSPNIIPVSAEMRAGLRDDMRPLARLGLDGAGSARADGELAGGFSVSAPWGTRKASLDVFN